MKNNTATQNHIVAHTNQNGSQIERCPVAGAFTRSETVLFCVCN